MQIWGTIVAQRLSTRLTIKSLTPVGFCFPSSSFNFHLQHHLGNNSLTAKIDFMSTVASINDGKQWCTPTNQCHGDKASTTRYGNFDLAVTCGSLCLVMKQISCYNSWSSKTTFIGKKTPIS